MKLRIINSNNGNMAYKKNLDELVCGDCIELIIANKTKKLIYFKTIKGDEIIEDRYEFVEIKTFAKNTQTPVLKSFIFNKESIKDYYKNGFIENSKQLYTNIFRKGSENYNKRIKLFQKTLKELKETA